VDSSPASEPDVGRIYDPLAAKILIVDDQIDIVELLEMILKRAGYSNIVGTMDSRTVLDLYVEHRFDLILLDIRMPHLDGFQVMERLSGAIANDYLPILALTARQDMETRMKAIKAGAKDFVTKPFDYDEVLNRIKNMLEVRLLHNQLSDQNMNLKDLVAERTKQLELEKIAAESANVAKSNFLASISHELRTPLNAIAGFSELIEHELFGPLGDPRYAGYARDIQTSGRHLLAILNDILDQSQIEAGKAELDGTETTINLIIEACIPLVRARAKAAGVGISLDIANDLPRVILDVRRMKQILINILSNGIKFSGPESRVTIAVAIDGTGAMEIAVRDAGIGMRAEDIPKALEPFGQIDSSLSRRYEGAGLGLSLAKLWVEAHGGQLEIDSELNIGTTVRVLLPPERLVPISDGRLGTN